MRIRLTLGNTLECPGTDGRHYRREEWTITGGEIDPSWRYEADSAGRGPSSCFTLYVIDGKVDRRLAGYGGAVWPIAWSKLFTSGSLASLEITDLGLDYRNTALQHAPACPSQR